MTQDEIIEMVKALIKLAVAKERERNTKLLYKMHERAVGQHNYYKHAAIEINRKDGEGELI